MNLKEYIEEHGIRKNFIAKKLGISTRYLYDLIDDKCMPSAKTAIEIEDFTQGKVKVREWVKRLDLKQQ
jgi:DNA-binding XRE family transcriptional regulator